MEEYIENMIVLQLTSDYLPNPLWGMGWHVKFLTDSLRKRDVSVYVGTASKSRNIDNDIITTGGDVDKYLLSNKPYEIFGNFKKFLTWQRKLGEAVVKRGVAFDIVHCHNWMSWLSAVEVKKKYPETKIVSTFHLLQKQYDLMSENPIPSCHDRIVEIEKEMLINSDIIVLQSLSQLNLLKSEYGLSNKLRKVRVIESGIELNPLTFDELYNKKLMNPFLDIVFVGRIEKDKGIYQTLNAFSNLSGKYGDIRLHVVGKGPILAELSYKFNSKRIIFHGFVDRNSLEDIIAKSFIFCLPTSSESFGNSVVEAMMLGAVPVVSKGKTIPVLFRENFHGLKIPLRFRHGRYEANEEDVTQKIDLLLSNRNLLKKFSRKAYKFSRSFYSMDKMAERMLKLYKETLG